MRETLVSILIPVGLYLALGILNALIAKRSQIDAWAEANPRAAALLKMMRALGLDPWMALQSLTLLVKGRLPLALKGRQDEPPRVTPIPPPATGPVALFVIAFVALTQQACSSAAPPLTGPCTVTDFATMEAKARECEQQVAHDCPSYVKGTCSKARGAPCPECPAAGQCARWFEDRCS